MNLALSVWLKVQAGMLDGSGMTLSPHVESSLFLRVAWTECTPEIAELFYIKYPDYQLTNQGLKALLADKQPYPTWYGIAQRGLAI